MSEAKSSTMIKKETAVGRWVGRPIDQPFENWADIDIFHDNDQWHLRNNSRQFKERAIVALDWVSENTFAAAIPNWIISTEVQLIGHLQDAKILTLDISGNGMTGLEKYDIVLRKVTEESGPFAVTAKPVGEAFSETGHVIPSSSVSSIENKDCIPNTLLEALLSDIQVGYSAPTSQPTQPRIDAMIILKNDKTVMESYYSDFSPSTLHLISSNTKSVAAILAGIAIDQKLMSVDDIVLDFFPECRNISTWGDDNPIRLHHLLSMTSGTKPVDADPLLLTSDLAKLMLSLPRTSAPGTTFAYDNGLPSLLACIIERKSGIPLEEFTTQYLFAPLGITNYRWTYMREPSINGATPLILSAGGLSLTLRDMAKFGTLMLNRGLYEDARVLSEESVAMMTRQQTTKEDYPYGFYWHISNAAKRHIERYDTFMALGQGEQVIVVVPELDLVVAAVSSTWAGSPSEFGVLGCLNRNLFSQLS